MKHKQATQLILITASQLILLLLLLIRFVVW